VHVSPLKNLCFDKFRLVALEAPGVEMHAAYDIVVETGLQQEVHVVVVFAATPFLQDILDAGHDDVVVFSYVA
jgi:hypothetical protein